jgi:hypothetical protein
MVPEVLGGFGTHSQTYRECKGIKIGILVRIC